MKFTFEISRSAAAARLQTQDSRLKTGDVIRSASVNPDHAGIVRQFPRRMSRMYDAASTDGLSADFPISIQSANAEILVSAIAARSRARRLERDNPYAWAMLNTFQNNVIGSDGFRLNSRVGKFTPEGEFIEERETNRMIEEWWCEAGLPENFTVRRDMSRLEAYLQACSALVRDGGILWRQWRGFPKNKFRYACEPIEIDRLDHNWNRPAVGTANEIQFGIEMDEFHAPIAFWILSRHPGDVFAWSSSPRYRERIDAADIIPLFDLRSRAGQYVGMPRFASVIKRLHREDQWDVSYVTAAIYAATRQTYLKRTLDAAADYKGDEETREGEQIDTVEPATARILPVGYEPVQMDPSFPMTSSAPFKKDNLRGVAAGCGLAYHTIANDLEGVNFSSGRLGENAQREEFKKLQNHLITNLVRPDFNERLRYAILSGQLNLPPSRIEEFQKAARFTGKRWPYVNPLQDAQADLLRIEAGLDSRQHVVAESDRGGSFEDVCAEQGSDNEVAEIHGLDFHAEATEPAAAGGEEPDSTPAKPDPESPPPKKGSKQTIKSHSRSRDRLDRTLRILAVTGDPHRNGH